MAASAAWLACNSVATWGTAARRPSQAAAAPPTSSPLFDDRGLLIVDGDWDVFVGHLRRNEPLDAVAPLELCLEDGQLWQGANYRLARTHVFGLEDDIDPAALQNPVALLGSKELSLDEALTLVGSCPFGGEDDELGGDWLGEGVYYGTHARLRTMPYIRATTFVVLTFHEVIAQNETTTSVRVQNPLNLALGGLTWRLHYKGGASSLSKYVERDYSIAPGQRVETPLARFVEERRAGEPVFYYLRGLIVEGRVANAEVALELPLN